MILPEKLADIRAPARSTVEPFRRAGRRAFPCRAAVFVLCSALLLEPYAAYAASSEPRPPSTIEVTAEAEVEVAPDLAVLQFAVRTQAESAAVAARENGERMKATVAALRKALGADARIQTGSYTLRPDYTSPRDSGPPQVVGYVATNTLQIRAAELARLGEIIDLAIKAGANQVQRIAFTLRDQNLPLQEALRNAALAARAKAEAIAAALGLKVTGFHSLVEQDVGDVRPLVRDAMLARAETAVGMPIEPGLIQVRARVVLTVLVAR